MQSPPSEGGEEEAIAAYFVDAERIATKTEQMPIIVTTPSQEEELGIEFYPVVAATKVKDSLD